MANSSERERDEKEREREERQQRERERADRQVQDVKDVLGIEGMFRKNQSR